MQQIRRPVIENEGSRRAIESSACDDPESAGVSQACRGVQGKHAYRDADGQHARRCIDQNAIVIESEAVARSPDFTRRNNGAIEPRRDQRSQCANIHLRQLYQ